MRDKNTRYQKYISSFQESRWATQDEIERRTSRINLSTPPYRAGGIPLMNDGRTAFVDNRDNHSLVFGSTGSKKTRLFVLPMLNILANAGESFVATDPKGELYERTGNMCKEMGYQVVVLNMRNFLKSDCWNPLALAYDRYHAGDMDGAASTLNDLISAIAQPSRETTKDIFWIQASESLLLGCGMILLETAKKEEVNMASLIQMCLEYGRPSQDSYLYKLEQFLHPLSIASQNLRGVLLKNVEKTQQSIMTSLFAMLRIFTLQKSAVRMLSSNSFSMSDIGKKKTAVYLVIPDEKDTFHFLASIFIKQCYETLIGEAQHYSGGMLPVRVNFVLDEFANIPAIPSMANMITAARSRNIRFNLIIQSMHQLTRRYEEDAETLKGNCANWIFLNSKELNLLREISELCGSVTTSSGNRIPLISVSQLQRLDKFKGESLIFCDRAYPFITEMADIDSCVWESSSAPVWPDCSSSVYQIIDLKTLVGNLDEVCDPRDESTLLFYNEGNFTDGK